MEIWHRGGMCREQDRYNANTSRLIMWAQARAGAWWLRDTVVSFAKEDITYLFNSRNYLDTTEETGNTELGQYSFVLRVTNLSSTHTRSGSHGVLDVHPLCVVLWILLSGLCSLYLCNVCICGKPYMALYKPTQAFWCSLLMKAESLWNLCNTIQYCVLVKVSLAISTLNRLSATFEIWGISICKWSR